MAKTLRLFTQVTPVLLQLAVMFRVADGAAQTTPTVGQAAPSAQSSVAPPASTNAVPSTSAPATSAAPVEAPPASEPQHAATTLEAAPEQESADAPSSIPAGKVDSSTPSTSGPCPCVAQNGQTQNAVGFGPGTSPELDRPSQVNKGPKLPIREERPWMLSAEWGWNSLVGMGPVASHHFTPHFTVDAGAGLSLEGTKVGARVRYNFLKSDLTPFLGLGAMHAFGIKNLSVREANEETDDGVELGDVVAEVRIKPSTYAQLVTGLDWTDRNTGVNLTATAGYAQLLQKDNIEILSGELEGEDRTVAEGTFGSGIVLALAMGYSF